MNSSYCVHSDAHKREYKIASYLFCRYLEQNGLYDYSLTIDGYNYEEKSGLVRECRSFEKVFNRCGAAEVLNISRPSETNLVDFLVDNDIIWLSGKDVALSTGYWRIELTKLLGYLNIFDEGYNSVPRKYIPSYNGAIETYILYTHSECDKKDVKQCLSYFTEDKAESLISEVDSIFNAFREHNESIYLIENNLKYQDRFEQAVRNLKIRVMWLQQNNLISKSTALDALELNSKEYETEIELNNDKIKNFIK